MDRKDLRHSGEAYSIQVTRINGDSCDELNTQLINLDNISRGGFRFTTTFNFEVEDRVKVLLSFPDDTVKDVFGRICYSEAVASDNELGSSAYGFSILQGFYELAV